MTKGKALLEARRFLGPSGHVQYRDGEFLVGVFDDFGFRLVLASQASWGDVIEAARKSPEAKQWSREKAAALTEIKGIRARIAKLRIALQWKGRAA